MDIKSTESKSKPTLKGLGDYLLEDSVVRKLVYRSLEGSQNIEILKSVIVSRSLSTSPSIEEFELKVYVKHDVPMEHVTVDTMPPRFTVETKSAAVPTAFFCRTIPAFVEPIGPLFRKGQMLYLFSPNEHSTCHVIENLQDGTKIPATKVNDVLLSMQGRKYQCWNIIHLKDNDFPAPGWSLGQRDCLTFYLYAPSEDKIVESDERRVREDFQHRGKGQLVMLLHGSLRCENPYITRHWWTYKLGSAFLESQKKAKEDQGEGESVTEKEEEGGDSEKELVL